MPAAFRRREWAPRRRAPRTAARPPRRSTTHRARAPNDRGARGEGVAWEAVPAPATGARLLAAPPGLRRRRLRLRLRRADRWRRRRAAFRRDAVRRCFRLL